MRKLLLILLAAVVVGGAYAALAQDEPVETPRLTPYGDVDEGGNDRSPITPVPVPTP